jgi:7-cyano-7-deazaguanine synthase
VLLSGGLDSACLASLYVDQGWIVRALFVDYGQAARNEEVAAAESIATGLSLNLERVDLSGLPAWPTDQAMPGRNGLLLLTGLAHAGSSVDVIAIGVHGGSRYWDCSAQFVAAMQTLFDGYTLGVVQVGAPFLGWSKREIYQYGKATLGPIDATYSCERPAGPCGKCGSCLDVADAAS